MTHVKLIGAFASVFAIAALTACQPAPTAKPAIDTAKVADAVKADVHAMLDAFNAHDVAKAVSHDAPDVVGMFHGAPNYKGLDGDTAMSNAQVTAIPDAKVEVSDETVDVPASGEMAVYHATYSFTGTDAKSKKPAPEKGNWLIGYKQVDGAWKIAWTIISDVGTGDGVPAPAPAAAPAPSAAPAASEK